MAEFILKDWHGKEKSFDHETIYVRGTDGELMPFTHGTGNPVLEELEVTENGSYTPSEGVDGFGSVKVNVPDIPAVLQNKEVTENGEYTADDGYDGLGKITVNVPDIPAVVQPLEVTENGEYAVPDGVDGFNSVKVAVPSRDPVVQPIEITENGTYTAPDGVDGFSSVTVNVGAAKIAVLEEHEMTGFAPDTVWGYSTLDQAPSYTINEGEQYYVKWDGVTYPVKLTDGSAAVAGATYLGNGSAFNLPGNGEPFAIVFVNGMILYTAFNDPKESHTIGIYKDGSGGSDELKYVTFKSYDGSVEYGKKAVANGDNCADPIARGVFSTPTREADAQYTYTFYSWATEPNGGADANWNKAITEDKTVYANFSGTLRSYTNTFYDEDGTTVLKTETLVYGATPSYVPSKEGFIFTGWNPAVETVTGDASYTAQWKPAPTFATATWAEIAEICASGGHAGAFSIGDSKNVKLTYADGTTETIGFTIVDMNTEVKDKSTKATAALTLMANNILKNSLQPASTYKTYATNIYDHENAKTFLSAVFAAMPTDLQAVITPVYKKDSTGYGYYSLQSTIFIPTEYNLLGSESLANNNASASSRNSEMMPRKRYQHFANGATIKRTKLADSSYDDYWTSTLCLLSISNTSDAKFNVIDGTTVVYASGYSYECSYGVVPCFCIG
jgi:hypothetical protein